MGRLPSVMRTGALAAVVGVLTAVGCKSSDDEPRVTAPRERSQAIERPAGALGARPSAQPSAPPVGSARGRPRKLCGGRLDRSGPKLPGGEVGRAQAPGVAPLPESIPVGDGKLTWLSLWAAWCEPCKEEMPRLLAWQTKLGAALRVVFVSLDDDERQLHQFLGSQSAGGVRTTYWLREGAEREDWLTSVGIDPDPQLPAHILVGVDGRVRCVVNGVVEDEDYPQLSALLGR